MAYASWSVVFGEQPSAAKWNILGTNDASFNDGTGIAANTIGSSQLKAAVGATGSSGGDFGTGPVTCASISIPAGTWAIVAKGVPNFSVSSGTSATLTLVNTTDTITYDTSVSLSEYVSGTADATVPSSLMALVTVAGTKTVIVRAIASSGSGTTSIDNVVLIAMPAGV